MPYPFDYLYKPKTVTGSLKKAGTLKASSSFGDMVKLVVLTNEGGYFHRNMLKDGRLKDPKGLMSAGEGRKDSGETMYGIDRVNGGELNTSPAGKKFWKIIDDANAKDKWKWNFMGGDKQNELLSLCADMMKGHYESLAKKYLTPESKSIVDNSNRLLYHFIYASWNGEGWFKKFAAKFNNAVSNGERNENELCKVAIASRVDSGNTLISQGGKKIEKLFTTLS